MRIQDFEPINSKEKVDQIITFLLEGKLFIKDRHVENYINLFIKKLKIQLYFKAEYKKRLIINEISNDTNQNLYKPKKSPNRSNRIKKDNDKETLNDLTVLQLSKEIDQPVPLLCRILNQKNKEIEFDENTIVTKTIKKSISGFISSAKRAKSRKEKYHIEPSEASLKTYLARSKPQISYGTPGNYHKLIYIKSK